MNRTEGAAPGSDELAILRLIQRWILLRDTGDWARLRTIWHDDGTMTAGWRRGTADEFIAASKARWEDGRIRAMHRLGAIEVEIHGERAISQNKVTILMRASVEGVLCDVTCDGRHLDRWRSAAASGACAAVRPSMIATASTRSCRARHPCSIRRCRKISGTLPSSWLCVREARCFPIEPDFPAMNTATGDTLLRDWRAWLHA